MQTEETLPERSAMQLLPHSFRTTQTDQVSIPTQTAVMLTLSALLVPAGSSGYDPPSWPPVGLGLVFDNVEWAPQVFVVLFSIGGTAVLHSLWTSLFP